MLLVRLASKPERIPRFGRILSDAPNIVELLDGDPLGGHAAPTGERLPYTPDEWQADPDGSTIELLKELPSPDQALFLEQRIEERLGIEDAPVGGEYRA